jgi:hypothetical protein
LAAKATIYNDGFIPNEVEANMKFSFITRNKKGGR